MNKEKIRDEWLESLRERSLEKEEKERWQKEHQ